MRVAHMRLVMLLADVLAKEGGGPRSITTDLCIWFTLLNSLRNQRSITTDVVL